MGRSYDSFERGGMYSDAVGMLLHLHHGTVETLYNSVVKDEKDKPRFSEEYLELISDLSKTSRILGEAKNLV